METRSKTKANVTANEAERAQRDLRERSQRDSSRPVSDKTDNGVALALPPASVSTQPTGTANPNMAHCSSAHASTRNEAGAEAPPRSYVHSEREHSARTNSTRSSATVRAQMLAMEAELLRRRAERERQQLQREQQLADMEFEAEQRELQAKLAALEASDKSHKSCFSNKISEKLTASWVLEQNANSAAKVPYMNIPGEAQNVTVPHTNKVTFQAPESEPLQDPITKLAQAINALSNRPKKLELISFSGEAGQWMPFKTSYERTKCNFSPSENIDRLNNAVRGLAYQSVASLLWTSGDPDSVVSALEQTYARPELLVAREVAELRNSPKISTAEDLNRLANKIRNFVSTLKILKQNEYLFSPELFRCILLKLNEHTRARFTDFAFVFKPEERNCTKLEALSQFLLIEADKQLKYNFVTETTSRPHMLTIAPPKFQLRKETIHATVSCNKQTERCTYCKQGPHDVKTCKKFLGLTIDDRWRWVRESKTCYRCLKCNPHTWNNCRAKRCGVNGCPRRHNALLHGVATSSADSNTALTLDGQCNLTSAALTKPTSNDSLDSAHIETEHVTIANSHSLLNTTGTPPTTARLRGLLKVVPVVVEGPDGEFETTALLDEGSTATLIDGEVAARIGAKASRRERLRIEGVSGMAKEVEVSFVNFHIRGLNQTERHAVTDARAITPLGLRVQNKSTIDFAAYDHLSDLAEDLLHADVTPTVLIGAPDWHLSLSREVRSGKKNEPVASRTLLGWVLHGALSVSSKPLEFVNHTSADDLDFLIKTQYDIDALGVTKNVPRTNEDDTRAINLIESTARRLDDGHFEVGLPWKKDLPKFIPDSYPQALSRFHALERQMSKDASFASAFQQFIDGIIAKGYAEPCDPTTYHQRLPPNSSCADAHGAIRWYLPIFGVFHPQKKKLRAVHDAAAVTKGISLNSLLLQGPDLLCSLLDILFRFREGAVALNADIREMFPQIKITPRDRDAQRFLWRDKDGNIVEYRMSSMIFGAVSSPFIALYIKNKNAKTFETSRVQCHTF